jgi:hypothetical protein
MWRALRQSLRGCPALPATAAILCAACAATAPCRVPSDCSAGNECLANQCRALGAQPVAAASGRVVAFPRRSSALPVSSSAGLDFEFVLPRATESPGTAALGTAFLIVPTRSRPALAANVLRFEVRRLLDPWPEPNSNGHAGERWPSRASVALAHATATAGTPARIEVTELLQDCLQADAGCGLRLTALGVADVRQVLDGEPQQNIRLELYPPSESPGGRD